MVKIFFSESANKAMNFKGKPILDKYLGRFMYNEKKHLSTDVINYICVLNKQYYNNHIQKAFNIGVTE